MFPFFVPSVWFEECSGVLRGVGIGVLGCSIPPPPQKKKKNAGFGKGGGYLHLGGKNIYDNR
jgi:hypothetical protein